MKAPQRPGEQTLVRVLQLACAAMVAYMMFSPSWRAEFAQGWREARDRHQDPPAVVTEAPPDAAQGADR